MNKSVGFFVSFVGLVILILGIKPINESVSFVKDINPILLLIVGVVIIGIGVFISRAFDGRRKVTEVPIFHGKDVVGYRRTGKKP